MDRSTQTPKWPIEASRNTAGPHMVRRAVHDLSTDTLQSHNDDIREYIQAFREHLYQLDRAQLGWSIAQELRQLLFLINLGPSFSDFRGHIYQCYKVAGCGDGPELTLDQLMEKAEDEWHRLKLEKKISLGSGFPRRPSMTNSLRPIGQRRVSQIPQPDRIRGHGD
ncbi:hypothetical protein M431DRAFT_334621 [Trichoderma harzianum CBS 226.95]|uniref:Retrotransposon gag domain-containing protein n=1 Tax=Trichoderma harzianum CBS 226.95 TaxID=983964 RepID=A0A2T3ZTA3_TRIHA|nr:hypothetical protein M431DRAFT_334621 [Trichoderma harzianum CBS 226.95]PTB48030.1 hypothetical protein M431DRAFT_334621 [Trichoderma harzianum CBS 226.95]